MVFPKTSTTSVQLSVGLDSECMSLAVGLIAVLMRLGYKTKSVGCLNAKYEIPFFYNGPIDPHPIDPLLYSLINVMWVVNCRSKFQFDHGCFLVIPAIPPISSLSALPSFPVARSTSKSDREGNLSIVYPTTSTYTVSGMNSDELGSSFVNIVLSLKSGKGVAYNFSGEGATESGGSKIDPYTTTTISPSSNSTGGSSRSTPKSVITTSKSVTTQKPSKTTRPSPTSESSGSTSKSNIPTSSERSTSSSGSTTSESSDQKSSQTPFTQIPDFSTDSKINVSTATAHTIKTSTKNTGESSGPIVTTVPSKLPSSTSQMSPTDSSDTSSITKGDLLTYMSYFL